ncbi:hypothetical protein KSS87_015122 [Heliosperma pusillum]|nr:hypothetical protein KSS87_015122 [Heliosperma pusillum]
MAEKKYVVEVEKAKKAKNGKPSIGPVYRSVVAKDGFPSLLSGMETCWDIFRISVEKFPENRMLGYQDDSDDKGGRCGIYSVNCPKWVISMQACNAHGLHCVPLYDSLGSDAVEYIICHAEVSIAFVEEKKVPEVLKTMPRTTKHLRSKLNLQALVSFGKVAADQKEAAKEFCLEIYSWDDFLELGSNQHFDLPAKKKDDICTIMYTSGTTSEPKGVLISNETVVTVVSGINFSLKSINEEDVKLLSEDIKQLKPTILCTVPRVFNGEDQCKCKLSNMNSVYKHEEASPLFDKIVFSKIKEGLGGNLRLILSGGAPLAPTVETFLRVVTCAHVLQGYGLTESCAASFIAQPNDMAMIGTVGPPSPNVDVCLESVPEMEYDALGSVPRGEICIRGNTLFSGYYKREDLTKEVMVDGWFHTG